LKKISQQKKKGGEKEREERKDDLIDITPEGLIETKDRSTCRSLGEIEGGENNCWGKKAHKIIKGF